ncbi:11804_t:CDS:2 [Gigaspora margarita]|uniref:11804_t:CDS:1 n=1 Tax=Gigaspora margarita TaxID=4874 RepID=A0ABN7VCF8_GIGMA|nr:11804_t:CDS:2 [Gigaspora margarita]
MDGHNESKGMRSLIPYNELQDIKVLNEALKYLKSSKGFSVNIANEFAEGGNLFDNLSESYKDIPWQKKLTRLQSIIKG